jgi:alcohol dehydrogenase class IV
MDLSKTLMENENMTVYNGQGALNRLDGVLCKYENILLFNDANGFEPCGAADYFNKTAARLNGKNRLRFIPYTGKALPIEDIESIYREVKAGPAVDLAAAVGGGTVIDLANVISIALSNNCEKAEEVLFNKELQNQLDLLFIPTTAGTGSEATSFAVVYKDKIKYSVDNQSLLPGVVVLDPLLLRSLPETVLNATVLDALAQAIESAWARGGGARSREYSFDAIRLIRDNLETEHPFDIDRLANLQMGSHLAGKAINISRTTLPHSISYPMTSHFGIAHGVAVFLTLPRVAALNYHAPSNPLLEKTFDRLFSLFQVDNIDRLVETLTGVMTTLGFKTRLRDYGIEEKDLAFLADNALTKGRGDNNPRDVKKDEVLQLLGEIY